MMQLKTAGTFLDAQLMQIIATKISLPRTLILDYFSGPRCITQRKNQHVYYIKCPLLTTIC